MKSKTKTYNIFKRPKTMQYWIMLLVLMLSVVGCRNKNQDVSDTLLNMAKHRINLSTDGMRCIYHGRDTTIVDSVKPEYTIIVYIDSAECSPCALDHIHLWNDILEENRKHKGKVKTMFVVAPKAEQIEDTYLSLEYSHLKSHVYVDTMYLFRKRNPNIPKDKKYHTFLVNNHDSIIVTGNPVTNERIYTLYHKTINN